MVETKSWREGNSTLNARVGGKHLALTACRNTLGKARDDGGTHLFHADILGATVSRQR